MRLKRRVSSEYVVYTVTYVQKLSHKSYLFPFSNQQKINQQAESGISISFPVLPVRAESMKTAPFEGGQFW